MLTRKHNTSLRYSPPINVSVTDLAIKNSDPLFLAIVVHNNARNLQIPLANDNGLNVQIAWSNSSPGFTHSQWFHLQ